MVSFFSFTTPTVILAAVAAANFVLGALLSFWNREKSSLFFAGAIFSLTAWTLGITIYTHPDTQTWLFALSKWNYLTGCFISLFFLLFCLYFGNEERKLSPFFITLLIFATTLLIALFLWPASYHLIISDISIVNGVKKESFGILYPLYTLYVLGLFVIGFTSLAYKFKRSTGIFRTQLKYVFSGTIVATIFAVTTNIVLPSFFGIAQFVWLGPVGTLVMVLAIFYAITKHGLWDFKLVATEIFSAALVIILLIETLTTETWAGLILKGGVFMLMVVFSMYLVLSMLREVESRERIERLAENLTAANKRLLELDVEKSDFVSIASHQLRTPLTVIKGYASMLLEGSLGPLSSNAHREAVDKIYQASQRLVLMIEDFLNISRIEKGEMIYNMARVDFRELVTEVIADIKTTIEGEKLAIRFENPAAEEFYITGDHLKLRQVISNIIDNAIKYTPPGGQIAVRLTKDSKAGSIIFSVADTGVGLTAEAQGKLFQKFSRAKGMSKLHTEGRGLGLYVAKQIIEAHGGQIQAYSAGKDQGATFTVVLPFSSQPLAPITATAKENTPLLIPSTVETPSAGEPVLL